MGLRETYQHFIPVFLSIFFLHTGINTLAQDSLLNQEINLSRNTGEIRLFLKELARKGDFSFTYTSQIETSRPASVLNRKQTLKEHLSDLFRYDSIRIIEQNNKILLVPLIKSVPVVLHYRSVKGIIIDSRTRRPLSYSSVFLSNQSKGTIANSAGRFELKITSSEFNDTLDISHIGYELFTMPLSAIDTGMLIVRLSAEKVQIKEIIVKPQDPIYILTKAIERIPMNYDRRPAIYTGFFRESTRQDNKNVSLSEAIIHVFKEPYQSSRDDQIKIYKARKGSNINEKEFVEFIVEGGLFNTLKLDIAKNLPSFLDADYFALYEYRIEKIITHLDRPTYVISFDQRQDVKYPCYKGNVYIDVESLAIAGAVFEIPETGMNYAAAMYVKKTPRHTGAKPLNAQYHVFYRLYNGRWNLSNVRSQILIRVRRKRDKQQDKFNSVFSSTSEFVVTNKDTLHVMRFRTEEISRPKDILERQIGTTDYEFWGEENIIIPDEPVEKAILRLHRRNSILTEEEIESIRIKEEKDSAFPGDQNANDNDSQNGFENNSPK